jgi:hypothetical protein
MSEKETGDVSVIDQAASNASSDSILEKGWQNLKSLFESKKQPGANTAAIDSQILKHTGKLTQAHTKAAKKNLTENKADK